MTQGRGEDVRVLDRHVVVQRLGAARGEPLDDAQPRAVMIPRPVEPGHPVEAGRLDHEGLAFPVPVRPPHPGVGRRLHVVLHVDGAHRAGELVEDHDVRAALDDLERMRHVGGARHARQIALDGRVARQAVGEVLVPSRERLGPVRNGVAFDHAEPAGRRAQRAQIADRTGAGRVRLDVPVRAVERLPDPVQIGPAVRRAGRRVAGLLGERRHGGRAESGAGQRGHDRPGRQPASHRTLPGRCSASCRSASCSRRAAASAARRSSRRAPTRVLYRP